MDVCLVSMPYGAVSAPSIAIGALVAEARRAGLDARAAYASFWFAERIGLADYTVLSEAAIPHDLLAEWTFSGAAFPGFEADHEAFLAPRLHRVRTLFPEVVDLSATLWAIREMADAFVTEAAERVLALRPRIVGCSSTFQQHCASLALLRKLKELEPETITMLGGANCMGAMGATTHRAFPWVDFVVSGEADRVFPWLCRTVLEKGTRLDQAQLPPGVMARGCTPADLRGKAEGGMVVPPITSLDDLAIPDFDDYFTELAVFTYKDFIRPGLPVETSRGCWWGQKHRCTFCGLFDSALLYRSKSAGRVLEELSTLAQRYSVPKFAVSDLILDMKYFKTVLPHLASQDPPAYRMYYETKANLSEEQVALLAKAGVRWIQPGIESFSDEVLKLMDKGSSALVNVALLKYSQENGIWVSWNLLSGFPGEKDEWYEEMSSWMPLLVHLQPPSGMITIRYDRFSEYWEQPARHGLTLVPFDAYAYVYPLPPEDLSGLAYFFEGLDAATHERATKGPGVRHLEERIEQWTRLGHRRGPTGPPRLMVRDEGERSVVSDSRPCAVEPTTVLEGISHLVYRACRRPRAISTLRADIEAMRGSPVDEKEVEEALALLIERKLLLSIGGRLLSLATLDPSQRMLSMVEFPGFNFAIVRRDAAILRQVTLSVAASVGG
jgi:ribosomal peptide maturation radical SAM protein 1